MRHLLTVVEQLDRAARELATDHPINNRLALIFVDNGVELMLHQCCLDHLRYEPLLNRLSPNQRRMARGGVLEGKLKVLCDLGDLTSEERRFIATAHHYRNELYHVGLQHDRIIRSLDGQYFLLACNLLTKLKYGYTINSGDIYTEISEEYLQANKAGSSGATEAFSQKLRRKLPTDIEPLPTVLAEEARRAIAEVEKCFGFIAPDTLEKSEQDAVLRVAQWLYDFRRSPGRDESDQFWIDPRNREQIEEIMRTHRASWKQKRSSLPLQRWRSRAVEVGKQSNPIVALDIYRALREDMTYLEAAISDAAVDLDKRITYQSEIERGK